MVCVYRPQGLLIHWKQQTNGRRKQQMNAENDLKESALLKYAVISPLLQDGLEACEKRQIRREILSREGMSERTLRRYLESYKKSGFNGLLPKERSDKGKSVAIPPEILEEAVKLKEELPQRSTRRIIKILEGENIVANGSVSRSTLDRHLSRIGVSTRELKSKEVTTGRRFKKSGRNMLWQTDIKYGPYLPDPENSGKKFRTYLVAFIDDATRFVCHSEFYAGQKLPVLEDCFRKSLIKCGVPDAVYVDNGKIFISRWFRIACARLGVRHIHTKPYSPESKGKIERFNRTVEEFFQEAALENPKSLKELNQLYRAWIEEGYNHSEHSSLEGKSPTVVWGSDQKAVRFVSPEECRDAFLWEETRKVDKTGCASLKGLIYEIGIEYTGKKVDLRYDPFDLEAVEVWHSGERKKTAYRVVVGEYCGKKTETKLVTEHKTHSRLLKIFAEESKQRQKRSLGAISFRSMKGGTENV
jgi:putative transposase